MESARDDSEVTIRTTTNVEGGTTCSSCVDKNMQNVIHQIVFVPNTVML